MNVSPTSVVTIGVPWNVNAPFSSEPDAANVPSTNSMSVTPPFAPETLMSPVLDGSALRSSLSSTSSPEIVGA